MSPAVYILGVLVPGINLLWIPYDIWAKTNHHNTISRQIHDWIYSPTIGPWFWATIAFILVLALDHFVRYHAH